MILEVNKLTTICLVRAIYLSRLPPLHGTYKIVERDLDTTGKRGLDGMGMNGREMGVSSIVLGLGFCLFYFYRLFFNSSVF